MSFVRRAIRPGVILALSCAAQFMVVLDIAIVNVALPSIQRDLGVSQSTLQWVVIAYGLLLGGFLLFGGRMADLLGRRRIFLTGLGVFSAASLLAGVAQSAGLLIAARGLQGFGAALVAPAALSLLAVTFPEGQERNRALGIFGAVAGTSASVGVIASGLLTDGPGWRWVFFINVPIGVLLIGLVAVFLAADRPERRPAKLDISGATTVTGGLLLLVYALNRGPEEPHARRRQPLGVLHLQRHVLVHLPRLAAHAAGPRILPHQDRPVLARDLGNRLRGVRRRRRPARRRRWRAPTPCHRPFAPSRRRALADAGPRRRQLHLRSATCLSARRHRRRTVRPVGPDRGALGRLRLGLRTGVRPSRDHARNRRRRRRRRRVDRARLPNRPQRLPRRVRRHQHHRRPRSAHRRHRLPARRPPGRATGARHTAPGSGRAAAADPRPRRPALRAVTPRTRRAITEEHPEHPK